MLGYPTPFEYTSSMNSMLIGSELSLILGPSVHSLLVLSVIVGATGVCWRLWLVLAFSKRLITRHLLLIGILRIKLLLHWSIYRHLQCSFFRHIILLEFLVVVLLVKACPSNDCRFHVCGETSRHASVIGCLADRLSVNSSWCVVIIGRHCVLR